MPLQWVATSLIVFAPDHVASQPYFLLSSYIGEVSDVPLVRQTCTMFYAANLCIF
jgi:hypothetical protein